MQVMSVPALVLAALPRAGYRNPSEDEGSPENGYQCQGEWSWLRERAFKGKISLTLFELSLKILGFMILFRTSSMHSSNTSIFTRMFLGIMPSDGRFPVM